MTPACQAGRCVRAALVGIVVACVGGCGGNPPTRFRNQVSMALRGPRPARPDADGVLLVVRPAAAGRATASCGAPEPREEPLAVARAAGLRTVAEWRCITRDTLIPMTEVSIRELRNHGGDVVDRAARGEAITITRAGKAVAELRPLAPAPLAAAIVLERWRRLPPIDPVQLRADIDETVDARV